MLDVWFHTKFPAFTRRLAFIWRLVLWLVDFDSSDLQVSYLSQFFTTLAFALGKFVYRFIFESLIADSIYYLLRRIGEHMSSAHFLSL